MKHAQRIKILVLAGMLVGTLVVFALPTVLGSKWVYQPLVDRLADERFELTIGRVQIGWLRSLEFEQIQLKPTAVGSNTSEASESSSTETNQEPAPLLSIAAIRSDRSLLGFLWGGRNLGTVEILEPNIDIQLLEDGSNLDRLVRAVEGKSKPKQTASSKKTPPQMDITIAVRGLHVTVTDEQSGQPVMVIPPLDATVAYKSLDVDSQVVIEPMKALDQVAITQELVHLGLSKAVPLLAKSTEFDGKVSLETERITIPLQHPQDSTGSARLTLHQVRSVPTHPTILSAIDILGRMFQRELPHELVFVDGSAINVEVANQMIKHDGVRAGLPRVDERLQIATSGSVGLVSRELNLDFEIPVPIEQVAKQQSVKQLGVPSITLPIRGTLDEPELDWKTLRQDSAGLLSFISGALSNEAPLKGSLVGALSDVAEGDADKAIEVGVDIVKDLVQRHREKAESKKQSDNADNPSEQTETPKRGRLLDALKGRLRGKEGS